MIATLQIRAGASPRPVSPPVKETINAEILRLLTAANAPIFEHEHPKPKQAGDNVIRRGDGMLFAWGEAKRNGEIEALLLADASAITGEPTIRAPGSHSDPVLAMLLAAEQLQLACAFTVNREVQRWAALPETRLWHDVANAYYASPYKQKNADVAEVLKISKRSVEQARTDMRRAIVLVVGLRVLNVGVDDSAG